MNARRKRNIAVTIALVAVTGSIVGAAYALGAEEQADARPTAGDARLSATSRVVLSPRPNVDQLRSRLIDLGWTQYAPSASATFETIDKTVAGSEWSLGAYANAAGDQCATFLIPGEGRTYSCRARTALLGEQAFVAGWGSRQLPGGSLVGWDESWVRGFAAPSVRSVEVILSDCSKRTTTPTQRDGAFLIVIGAADMRTGAWPTKVSALDARGKMVAQRDVVLGGKNAKDQAIEVPHVKECA